MGNSPSRGWIDRDYLEVLSKVADSENRNIVLNTNFKREYKEGESGLAVRHDPKEGLLAPGRYPASTAQAYAFPSLWIRLYRRKFLIDNDIRFPEDVYFTSLAGLLESEAGHQLCKAKGAYPIRHFRLKMLFSRL